MFVVLLRVCGIVFGCFGGGVGLVGFIGMWEVEKVLGYEARALPNTRAGSGQQQAPHQLAPPLLRAVGGVEDGDLAPFIGAKVPHQVLQRRVARALARLGAGAVPRVEEARILQLAPAALLPPVLADVEVPRRVAQPVGLCGLCVFCGRRRARVQRRRRRQDSRAAAGERPPPSKQSPTPLCGPATFNPPKQKQK